VPALPSAPPRRTTGKSYGPWRTPATTPHRQAALPFGPDLGYTGQRRADLAFGADDTQVAGALGHQHVRATRQEGQGPGVAQAVGHGADGQLALFTGKLLPRGGVCQQGETGWRRPGWSTRCVASCSVPSKGLRARVANRALAGWVPGSAPAARGAGCRRCRCRGCRGSAGAGWVGGRAAHRGWRARCPGGCWGWRAGSGCCRVVAVAGGQLHGRAGAACSGRLSNRPWPGWQCGIHASPPYEKARSRVG
jgi:hypothetical protein